MSELVDRSSDSAGTAVKPQPSRMSIQQWLVILGLAVLIIALSIPVILQVRTTAMRSASKHNFSQIGVALNLYYQQHQAFPPAYIVDAQGKPLHSWRTLLLPYLDHTPLYNSINLSKPWNDPANLKLFEDSNVLVYQCASARLPKTSTTYLAVVGQHRVFDPTRPRTLREFTDGTTNSVAMIEVTPQQAVQWMSPLDAYDELVLAFTSQAQHSHAGGTHMMLANGGVRFVSSTISTITLQTLLTIDGADGAVLCSAGP